MQYRRATAEEIIADKTFARAIEAKRPVRFRHFVRETTNSRAWNGVSHREHSRSALRVIDGKPHVMHHGKLEAVTATVAITGAGTEIIFDLRLDSPHLGK